MYTIYSKKTCQFCDLAKQLLSDLGEQFIEKDVSNEDIKRELLELQPDVRTVPQIFYNNLYVGGFTDLCTYLENNH